MPIDRATTDNARPLKPALATTRTAKTPITPRLAPSASSVASSQSTRTARNNVPATPRSTAAHHEDVTPVKAFLSSNITPRSSSRKSRVGVSSAESTPIATPTGTPSSTRPPSVADLSSRERGYVANGLGISTATYVPNASRPRSVVGGNVHATPTPRPPVSNLYHQVPSNAGGARATSPKFFHADDAKAQEPVPVAKRAPVFFYADGQQDESRPKPELPSPPLSAIGKPNQDAKFFHIDSLSDPRGNVAVQTPPPFSSSPEPLSTTNSYSNLSSQGHSLRPPSPSKENIHLSYRKGASQVIRPNLHSRPSALSIISGHSQIPELDPNKSRRRSSAASSAAWLGHGKSASLSSIDSVTSLKRISTNDGPVVIPSPLHNEKRVVSNESLPESISSAPAPTTEALSGLPSPNPQNSTNSSDGKSALERMNELAANARRERKVLDLEISNSSLLAINRQLEKEVRKQKAEIRRFRRMSRAGRFSTDTISSNRESFSAIGGTDFTELSDMSEGEEEEEEDHEYSDESSLDEGTMSPTTLAERDAAHRLRDEKRLQLDLSKHRELLIDSQKMNQSLKRCLNWTEELIKDANKALNYQVRVSDVRLGGRVLNAEEAVEPRQDQESRGLLSPWTPPHRAIESLEETSILNSERTDRDSGVDVDGMQPVAPDLYDYFSPLGSPLPAPTHARTSMADGEETC